MHIALQSKEMCTHVRISLLDHLVDTGANPKIRDGLGKTLWDYAQAMGEEIQDWMSEFFGGQEGCGDPNCTNCG
jgi:hypothetical protein